MKELIVTGIFIFLSLFSIAQGKINFMTFGFHRIDITNNPKIKLEKFLNVVPSGNLSFWEGFNHYEIDLKNKLVIHIYVGEIQGEKLKIFNLVESNDYYSFDVKGKGTTEEMSFLIPKSKNTKYNLLIKYKSGVNTRVALFDSASQKNPF
jgi:hypothetical protein